jgi:GNAT superfamily N-acetyltransferase
MPIHYAYDDKVSVDELFGLLDKMMAFDGDRFPARNVFHVALRDKEKEDVSLKNTVAVTARGADGNLLGYLRILTDRAYMFYILDVMVDPESRGLGIGGKLVEVAVNECKKRGFIKIFLTAIPGSEAFYKKYGFKEGMSPVLTMRGEDYV